MVRHWSGAPGSRKGLVGSSPTSSAIFIFWAGSSVGRAPLLHSGGPGFKSPPVQAKFLMVEIINFTQRKIDLEKIKKEFEKILKILGIEEKKVIFYFVGPSRMRNLNRKFRGKNKVTTVLSFPSPKDFVYPKEEEILGEIFLCLSYIKKLAKRANLDFELFFLRIAIHGILHLLGYEHQSQEGAKIFEAKEKEILNKVLKS